MDDLDHLISFLDLLGEQVNTAELVSILESCDFLHLSPEDFACLQELGDPAQAAALFTPTKGTTGFHQRSVQEDSQPQEQHAAEGESQKQDSEGSLLKAGHPIKGTRLAARLHEASSSSAREQPAENEIDVPFDSNGEADGKIDSSAENLFTLQASKSVGMVRCACGQVYCFLESNPCPVCGGHDPLGFLWASHSSEIIAKLQSQIVNACCQSPMGLFSVLDSIQSKLEQALARTRDPTALVHCRANK